MSKVEKKEVEEEVTEEVTPVEVEETKEEKGTKDNTIDKNLLSDKELRKMYGGRSPFQKVLNVVLWIILFSWMAVCLYDFYNVHEEKEPVFCLKEGTTKYDDGEVKWCLGAGYKVYDYKRASFKAIEFGPFWSKDRSAETNK